MSGDDSISNDRLTNPLFVLSDVTNLPGKRAFSLVSRDSTSKSLDSNVKNLDDNERGLNFKKRVCIDVENWGRDGSENRPGLFKGKQSCSYRKSVISDVPDELRDRGENRPVFKAKQSCSMPIMENRKSVTSDVPNQTRQSLNLLDANDSAARDAITIKSVIEVGDASRDSGEVSDASGSQDDCKILGIANLTVSKSGSVERAQMAKSSSFKSFELERCTAQKGGGSSHSSAGFDLIKSCGCAFCLKASYILSDLHCQDIKGRIAALKKSQKDASNLVQKFHGNSNKSSKLEDDLMNQWRSLFVHTEDQFISESKLLEESYVNLKELRESCKTNLEMIMMPPSDKE